MRLFLAVWIWRLLHSYLRWSRRPTLDIRRLSLLFVRVGVGISQIQLFFLLILLVMLLLNRNMALIGVWLRFDTLRWFLLLIFWCSFARRGCRFFPILLAMSGRICSLVLIRARSGRSFLIAMLVLPARLLLCLQASSRLRTLVACMVMLIIICARPLPQLPLFLRGLLLSWGARWRARLLICILTWLRCCTAPQNDKSRRVRLIIALTVLLLTFVTSLVLIRRTMLLVLMSLCIPRMIVALLISGRSALSGRLGWGRGLGICFRWLLGCLLVVFAVFFAILRGIMMMVLGIATVRLLTLVRLLRSVNRLVAAALIPARSVIVLWPGVQNLGRLALLLGTRRWHWVK